MQKLNFDTGVKEYAIGGGVLRFNPSDPNVYARFLEAGDKLKKAETELVAEAKKAAPEGSDQANGETMLRLLQAVDKRMKEILAWVFGPENDFDSIFGGSNVLSVGSNGEYAITNFITAITPILKAGAEKCARQQTNKAVAQAKMNRQQRRAAKKK